MVKRGWVIIWDDHAKYSLKDIYEYIKKEESVRVARKVRKGIVDKVKDLKVLPEKFSEEEYAEDESGNIRSVPIWSYKIIYEVKYPRIMILDIFHSSRYPGRIKRIIQKRKK